MDLEECKLRHVVEVRHVSLATQDFVTLTRRHEVAIVLAGDAKFPQIADITADFVYARIVGTQADQDYGYSASELDVWAQRARNLAQGIVSNDLATFAKPTPKQARDVFLYVIGGAKKTNPAAAHALIERLN